MEQRTSYTKYYKDVLGELPKIEDFYSWLGEMMLQKTLIYYLEQLGNIADAEPINNYITKLSEEQRIAYEVIATHIIFISEELKTWPLDLPSHVQLVMNVRVIRKLRWHNQLTTFRNRGVKEALKDLDTDWKVSRISDYGFLDFLGTTYSGARDHEELQEVLSLLDSFRYALFTLLSKPEQDEFPDIQQVITGIEPKVHNRGMIAPDLLNPASYLKFDRPDPIISMINKIDFDSEDVSFDLSMFPSDEGQQSEIAAPALQQTNTSDNLPTDTPTQKRIHQKTLALYHFYLFHKQSHFPINPDNAQMIAVGRGWDSPNSGKKLYQHFLWFCTLRNRTTPNNNPKSNQSRIKGFGEVIEMLKKYPSALSMAQDEMSLFLSRMTTN